MPTCSALTTSTPSMPAFALPRWGNIEKKNTKKQTRMIILHILITRCHTTLDNLILLRKGYSIKNTIIVIIQAKNKSTKNESINSYMWNNLGWACKESFKKNISAFIGSELPSSGTAGTGTTHPIELTSVACENSYLLWSIKVSKPSWKIKHALW